MTYLSKFAIAIGLLVAPSALATPYDTLQSIAGTYNVFLLGNLGSASAPFANTDTQGKVAVAGNAYIQGSAINQNNVSNSGATLIVGGNLTQTNGSISGNAFVGGNASLNGVGSIQNLVVGGSLTDNAGTIAGNVFVGGAQTNLSGGVTINGTLTLSGANSSLNASSNGGSSPAAIYVTSSTTVNDPSYWAAVQKTGAPATPTAPLDVFGSSTDIINASKSLSALSGAQTVSLSNGALNITLQNGSNVVNVTIPDGTTVTSINITTASGATPTGLIVNVAGNNLTFTGGANTGSLSSSQVLFNFGNAQAITLNQIGFQGTLLAPLATVSFPNGVINGDVIANSYFGPGQINWVGFNGPLPTYQAVAGSGSGTVVATPEPGSIALFGTGILVVGLLRRRRLFTGAAAI